MNLNSLATAALLKIYLRQVSQAYAALYPKPQGTPFRVGQEFCKKQPKTNGNGERIR